MTPAEILPWLAAFLGGGGLGGLVKTWIDSRRGRVSYATRLENRLALMESRQAWMENVNSLLWSHIGVLEAHIIDGEGPPPPARPQLPSPPVIGG